MARRALILYESTLTERELRLGRILDFFGVPWNFVLTSDLRIMRMRDKDCVVFGCLPAVAATLRQDRRAVRQMSPLGKFYAYLNDDKNACVQALDVLFGAGSFALKQAAMCSLSVSSELRDLTGPMSGLELRVPMQEGDVLLAGATADENAEIAAIISAGASPVFFRSQFLDMEIFICTSSRMVDINLPVEHGYYDVKEHFFPVVPLLLFLRFAFPEAAWRPQEIGACVIVDDPLLQPHYGFCDFARLHDLMQQYNFTTNISFIPWNWRRTSLSEAEFFNSRSDRFSVSIHGCDHSAGEFGATSSGVLVSRARLAQTRMLRHEQRTGVHHEPVMVFPQGVFSSNCPDVLHHSGFLAAVNTEIAPVDSAGVRTLVRDVWDVAIRSYGGFPIFTRRYTFHGIENFAFDLLLGKPCLIVTHHDSFRDGGAGLAAMIEKLGERNPDLRWRSLGEVVRRACRRRKIGANAEQVEMYGAELRLANPSERALEVSIRKRELEPSLVAGVLAGGKPTDWTAEGDGVVFSTTVPARGETFFQIAYRSVPEPVQGSRPLRYEVTVAVRRILSEIRDNYWSKVSRSDLISAKPKVHA